MKNLKMFEDYTKMTDEYTNAFEKLKNTIISCNSDDQILNTFKMYLLFKNKWQKILDERDYNRDSEELALLFKDKVWDEKITKDPESLRLKLKMLNMDSDRKNKFDAKLKKYFQQNFDD